MSTDLSGAPAGAAPTGAAERGAPTPPVIPPTPPGGAGPSAGGPDGPATAAFPEGDGSAETTVPADAEAVRRAIGPLAGGGGGLSITLSLVLHHRTDHPEVVDAPVDAALAAELLAECVSTARAAVAAELLPAEPGFAPGRAQWVFVPVDESLAELDRAVRRPSHEQYDRSTEFGRRTLLVVRVRDADGHVARLYQGFSPEKALGRRSGILAFWSGERFQGLTEEPLVIDRSFRVLVTGGVALMPAPSAYESLFGPPPGLREHAERTFAATFGTLAITGARELREACTSDPTMMRKMLSIEKKLAEPGFRAALTMPNLLAFLKRNPKIAVKVEGSGPQASLVFETDAQHRWALLKLLDDDYLHSELTSRSYEANSKSPL